MGRILTLDLPNDVYEAVKKAAEQSGQTPSGWITAELPRLLAEHEADESASTDTPIFPLYRLHEHAVDTGISDLAEQHDHYLLSRRDFNGS
ncbi:MAG: hypothetical protein M1546_17505 [Chloroflexi bacterium]|nr:hypothetical protein [Chloroflexota bacterium]